MAGLLAEIPTHRSAHSPRHALSVCQSPGMFVSESKFRSSPSSFIPHIQNPNEEALAALITKPAVEAALLVRLGKKARFYGQELDGQGNAADVNGSDLSTENRLRIDVDEVVQMYRDYIIPLTKEVEVSGSIVLPCSVITPHGRLIATRTGLPSFSYTRCTGAILADKARRSIGRRNREASSIGLDCLTVTRIGKTTSTKRNLSNDHSVRPL